MEALNYSKERWEVGSAGAPWLSAPVSGNIRTSDITSPQERTNIGVGFLQAEAPMLRCGLKRIGRPMRVTLSGDIPLRLAAFVIMSPCDCRVGTGWRWRGVSVPWPNVIDIKKISDGIQNSFRTINAILPVPIDFFLLFLLCKSLLNSWIVFRLWRSFINQNMIYEFSDGQGLYWAFGLGRRS